MPKSRNRKNHKKKVESWKNRKQQQINAANKEIQKIQENLMKQMEEQAAKSKAEEEIKKEIEENTKNPAIM
jgi:Skp family chaperone for outer membrane proteins